MSFGWKIVIVIVTVALIVGGVFLAQYLLSVKRYQEEVAALAVTRSSAAGIPTGVYTGSCDVNFIAATVEVEVVEGKMERITILVHKNERGKPAEAIIDQIIEAQSLDVDTVTGATNSSKVLKKSIENSLDSASV